VKPYAIIAILIAIVIGWHFVSTDAPAQSLSFPVFVGPSQPTDLFPWTDPVPGPDTVIPSDLGPSWDASTLATVPGVAGAASVGTSGVRHHVAYTVAAKCYPAHYTATGRYSAAHCRAAYTVAAR
jgi:hypothetical protein